MGRANTTIALALAAAAAAAPPADPAGELIQVFAHPEARGTNLPQTNKAIAALVRMGAAAAPKLIDAVVGDRSSDRTVAVYSLLALKRIGPSAVPAVRKRWPDLDDESRWRLMGFRGEHDYGPAAAYALTCLDHREAGVRRKATEFLGRHEEQRARKALLGKLNAEIPALRWSVVGALAALGGEDVIAAFIPLLVPDSWAAKGDGLVAPPGPPPYYWPDGRGVIIRALHRLRAAAAAPAMLRVLREKGPGKGYLGEAIVPALADLGFREALPELRLVFAEAGLAATRPAQLPPMRRPRPDLRLPAARALLQLGDRTVQPFLVGVLLAKDRPDEAGRAACDALADFGDRRDVPALVAALDDCDWGVRRSAVRGLERITGTTHRAAGWAEPTEHDAEGWRAWYAKSRPALDAATRPADPKAR